MAYLRSCGSGITPDGSILGAAHPGSRDPGVSLSSTLRLSCYSVRARALLRALAHTPRSTIAPECYIPLGCPTRIPTPDHTIPLHGLDGPTPSVTTTLRIVALQGPSRGTPAATSVARDERRKPAADALRDLVPGDLQHLASREYQGLQTLRLSGSTIPPRGIMASACLLGRPTAST